MFDYRNKAILDYPMTARCHDATNSKTLNVGRGGSAYDGTLVNTPTKLSKRGYEFASASDEHISIPVAAWPGTSGSFLATALRTGESNGTTRLIGTDHSSGNAYEHRTYRGNMAIGYADGTQVLGLDWGLIYKNVLTTCVWTWELDSGTTYNIFYENGKQTDADSYADSIAIPDTGLYLGRWDAQGFDGTIFHAGFTTAVLTPLQINDYHISMMKKINKV